MNAIQTWRNEVYEAADRLEAACAPLLLAPEAWEGVPDSLKYREGAPASGLPHVDVVLDIVRDLRRIAGDAEIDRAANAAE
jgi:hypothetical protein